MSDSMDDKPADASATTETHSTGLSLSADCNGDSPYPNTTVLLDSRAEQHRDPLAADPIVTKRVDKAVEPSKPALKPSLPKNRARRERLNLLNLPNDILEIIIKDVTHTNDLCALSLTCSALHSFAVPHIYSRFDIVWPDSNAHVDPKSGVDALTYGLSTLVMAEELFGEAPHQQQHPVQCEACGHLNLVPHVSTPRPPLPHSASPLAVMTRRRRRYGNHYAQYCRKFSLGNGPKEWVQDYMICCEAGKLLGTQVALAVARMRNLESFAWDMPTGILREVWMALASLDDRADGQHCKLERVWVRWHNNEQLILDTELQEDGHAAENNQAGPHPPPGSGLASTFTTPPAHVSLPTAVAYQYELENFSILPPLKSLSVLDIDVVNYLHEMAHLIGRSRYCLRELRVGIATHVDMSLMIDDLATTPQGDSLDGTQRVRNMGGVLGALFAHIFCVTSDGILRGPESTPASSQVQANSADPAPGPVAQLEEETRAPLRHVGPRFIEHLTSAGEGSPPKTAQPSPSPRSHAIEKQALPVRTRSGHARLSHEVGERLPLEILELERVPLSVFTLREALDWSKLTEITLIDCDKHEQFWRSLRRQFARPATHSHTWQTHKPAFGSPQASKSPRSASKSQDRPSYTLNIRKIHVNAVSPSLIAFTRDALAPHTLQTLFLHASSATDAQYSIGGMRYVSLDRIYRGPIRRHARSLVRLSVDSGLRSPAPSTRSAAALAPSRKSWTLTRDVLAFLTSGRLRALRELAVCLDHRDWHFFLQRLPALCRLRSLYIPQILDRSTGRPMDVLAGAGAGGAGVQLGGAREFAQQVLDIVVLRPEVQLCYLGMFDKCFEILEGAVAGKDGGAGKGESEDDDDDDDDYVDEGSQGEEDGQGDDGENEGHGHHDEDDAHDLAQGAQMHAPLHDATTDDDDDDDDDDHDNDNENDNGNDTANAHDIASGAAGAPAVVVDDEDDEDEPDAADSEEEDDEEEEDEDDEEPGHGGGLGDDAARSSSSSSSSGDRIRLREILFYDDKVAVFRARLGRL